MNRPLAFSAILEIVTGVVLIAVPSLAAQLLLGADLSGVGLAIGRVAGLGLLSLGVACWPGTEPIRGKLCGMSTYGVGVTLYLLYVGLATEWSGPLLWPVILLHTVLTSVLIRTLLALRSPQQS